VGIITSFFVHADESHLFNNMIGLFLFLVLLVVSNVFLSKEELKRRIFGSIVTIFSVPVILNLSLIFLFPDVKMIGSSGIVYTLEGRCFGSSLLNALELRKIRKSVQNERKPLIASSLSNLVVFAGLLLNLILFPTTFLGSELEAIIWFHGTAFCAGFLTLLSSVVLHRFKPAE